MEAEPELYQCEDCPYRIERARLTWHDEECLRLHRQLSGRAVRDLGLSDLVFDLARLRMSSDDAETLLPKLELIHDYANPLAQESGIGKPEGAE